MAKDLSTEVLIEIRDEMRGTRGEMKGMRDEITGMRGEITGMRGEITGMRGEMKGMHDGLVRLEKRQTETEIRLATELVAVVSAVNQVRDELRATRDLRESVTDHEQRIRKLEKQSA